MVVKIKSCVESTNQNVALTQPIRMFSAQVPPLESPWTLKRDYLARRDFRRGKYLLQLHLDPGSSTEYQPKVPIVPGESFCGGNAANVKYVGKLFF